MWGQVADGDIMILKIYLGFRDRDVSIAESVDSNQRLSV